MEGYAGARFQPPLIEEIRDFRLGVLIEEIVDCAEDLGRCAAQLKRIDGPRQLQGAREAAPETDVGLDEVTRGQSDILNEKPEQSLLLSCRSARILPQAGKVAGEIEHVGALPLAQLGALVGLALEIGFCFG
jgi:hypothetical protein